MLGGSRPHERRGAHRRRKDLRPADGRSDPEQRRLSRKRRNLTSSMAIVLLSCDLVTQSRVEAAAQRCGIALRTASSAASVLAKCVESPAAIVLLDLSLPMGDLGEVVEQLK